MARNKAPKPLTEAPPEPESSDSEPEEQPSGSSTEVEDAEQDVSSPAASSSADDDEDQIPSTPPPPFSSPSKKPTTVSTTTPITAKKPSTSQSSSSSEDEDSDEDNESPVAKLKSTSTIATKKPTSKPIIEPSSPPKPRSKPIIPTDKRPAENNDDKDKPSSKRPKKDKPSTVTPSPAPVPSPGPGTGTNEEVSKKLFQRVFSEEDEMEILKGLIEFKERKGGDLMTNDDEMYGYIRKRLHVVVNKMQLVDKVRRMKKRFTNANNSKKKNMNEHEKKLFELSKLIWEVKHDDDDDDDGEVKVNNTDNNGGVSKTTAMIKENDNGGGGKSVSKKSGKGDNSNNNDNCVVNVIPVSVVEGKKKNEEENEGKGCAMDEDFKVGEVGVKGVMRVEALRRMGAKGRAEIRDMWRKVENAQLEVDLMRSEARLEENRRIMEALGLIKR